MRFFKSAARPLPPKTPACAQESTLSLALVQLERRYVFDAALAGELIDHSQSEGLPGPADDGATSLGNALVQASQSAGDSATAAADNLVANEGAATPGGGVLYVIDANVDQRDVLIAGLPAGADILMIDSSRDGVVQLADALSSRNGVAAVHIFAHGTQGELSLGASVLNAETMNGLYRSTLASMGTHLSENADILVYGCNFADGATGETAAGLLASLTGADVAGSDDLTGAARLGGDWDLEYSSGSLETNALAFAAYDATLAPPVAVSETYSTAHNTAVSGDVSPNDTDPESDPLTFSIHSQPAHGTVTLNSNGTFTYTPDNGFGGEDFFIYRVTDNTSSNPNFANASVTIVVAAAPNAPPDAVNDSYSTNVNTAVSGDVCTNDSDPNGDTLTHTVASGPSNGTLTLNSNGTFTYTPNTGYTGTDTFTYTSNDGNGGTDTATVTITITAPTNNPPDAVNDSYSTNVNTAVSGDVCANDSDPDGDIVSHSLTSGPSNGTVTLNSNGTFTYTPNTGYTGTDTFTYTSNDGNGGTDTATVTITVNGPANSPPNAVNDSYSTSVNTAVSGDVCANDSDPDGDIVSHSLTSGPSNGTVTLNSNGTFTYTPNTGYTGTDTFTYTSNDGNGGTDTATVTISVSGPTNSPPNAVNDSYSTNVNTAVSGDVCANDSDPNGDTLTHTVASGPSNGTLTLNSNGTFTYTPNTGYTGTDTFTYTSNDGNGGTDTATVTISVSGPTNSPPNAVNDSYSTNVNTAVSGDVCANDSDPDGDIVSHSLTSGPSNGTVTLNSNGTFTYTPNTGYTGTDTFTYTSNDGNGGTDTATVTITVNGPANSPPNAVNDSYSTNVNTAVSGDVCANDSDPDGDTLSHSLTINPSHGTVTLNSNGTFTYTPNTGYTGTDTFTYTSSDGRGGTDTGTVVVTVLASNTNPVIAAPMASQTNVDGASITLNLSTQVSDADSPVLVYAATGLPPGLSINPLTGVVSGTIDRLASQVGPTSNGVYSVTLTVVDLAGGSATQTFAWTVTNPAPDAVNDTYSVNSGTVLTGSLAPNDSDPDGDSLTFCATTAPANGTVVVNANGSFTYTPNAGFVGTDSFTYCLTDSQGASDSAVATITVIEVNSAPVAVGSVPTQNNLDNGTAILNVASYFSDPDSNPLTYTVTGLPTGLSIDPATGVISGTIDRNACSGGPGGNGVYAITVTATDPRGLSAVQSFTWNVTNPGPVAVIDSFSTTGSATVTGTVATNDSDPDGDALTFSLVSQPAGGTLTFNPDGTFSYTARDLFVGTDSFTYRVTDANGATATAVASIAVAAPTVAPVSVTCINTFGDLSHLKSLLAGDAAITTPPPATTPSFSLNGATYKPWWLS